MTPGGAGPEGTNGRRLAQVSGPWTDITGSPSRTGRAFAAEAGNSNSFIFSIPTPVVRFGPTSGTRTAFRANLIRAFVLVNLGLGIVVTRVSLSDGARSFTDTTGSDVGTFNVNVRGDHSGARVRSEGDIANVLRPVTFALPRMAPVFWAVGIQVEVTWERGGQISFAAAGADFEVQDS